VVAPFEGDFAAEGIAARLELVAEEPGDDALDRAFTAWDAGDHAAALEQLQELVAAADPARRDRLRRVMVAIFTELGADSELAREHRRRLALALT
jgi:thioredoxin-like negative regulator of GroEL